MADVQLDSTYLLIQRSIQNQLLGAVHRFTRRMVYALYGTLKGTSRVSFNDFERQIAFQAKGNIVQAVTHFHRALKIKVDIPYPPASMPGEPPRKRTGRGQAAISRRLIRSPAAKFEELVYLKPSGFHMSLLEAGFVNQIGAYVEPRPWIAPTFEEERPAIEAILGKGFK